MCTDSAENGARSGVVAVQAILAANQAYTDDAVQDISVPPAESSSGNDGRAVGSPVQDFKGHDRVDFPSIYLYPFLLNEPLVDGDHFDIPGEDGQILEQVFEYSCLFHHIATLNLIERLPGSGSSTKWGMGKLGSSSCLSLSSSC